MIPDDVLERAAKSAFIERHGSETAWSHGIGPNGRDMWAGIVAAALPILIPAIRDALVREMMEQTHSWIIIKDDERGELMDSWLADFLPATEEDKP